MKTAIITGASGGIGLELAKLLAADGYHLVLLARSKDKLNEIASELTQKFNIAVDVFPVDLSVPDEVKRFIAYAEQTYPETEVLINNAGFGDFDLFADCSPERASEMILLNIHALTMLSRHFLPYMLKRKSGYIMNVASVAAFMPGPYMAVYYATKAYVLSLSQAIASEVKGGGVRVTAVCPGPVETGFMNAARLNDSRLFKMMKPAKATDVAKQAYAAMRCGKRIIVNGVSNKLMVFMIRFLPRKWVTASVKMISKPV